MNRSLAKLRNFCKTIDRSQDALVTNVRLHFDRPILRIVNEPKGFYRFHRRSIWFRTLSAFVLFFFCSHILFENIALLGVAKAEADPSSNFPHLLSLSTPFSYPTLRGIKTCSSQPFDLDILLDAQDNESVAKGEAEKLIRYFLSMLTIPEQEVWVNLSPYENDRITSSSLEWTEAGRDLLRQDYLLKRLSASLSYPESDTGKIYWEKVYRKAYETFGTTKIPINTFNKIWIVPEKAVVFDFGDSAVVGPTRLKVLLEEDYLALMKNTKKIEVDLTSSSEKAQSLNNISAAAFREVIIPILEKEVNEGEQFAATRQVFHSLILAIWFKNNLKRNIINNIYADQRKVAGVDKSGPKDKERIYQDYLMVFKEGVYNYRKRDYDAHLGKSVWRQE